MGKKVSFKEKMDIKDAVAYLDNVIKGLREGNLVLSYGDESIELGPEGEVKLEIEGEAKDRKGKLSIELSYKNEEKPESMTITTGDKPS